MSAPPERAFAALLEPAHGGRALARTALSLLIPYGALLALALRVPLAAHRPGPAAPADELTVTLLDAPALPAPGAAVVAPEPLASASPQALPSARPTRPRRAPAPRAPAPEDPAPAASTPAAPPAPLAAAPPATENVARSAGDGSADARPTERGGGVGPGATSAAVSGGGGGGARGGEGVATVLPFMDGMTRPSLLEKVDPEYTREAREANATGLILTKCVITVDGRLERCRIVKGMPTMDEAVLRALAKWRFTPVLYQGRPTAVEYVIPIRLVGP